MVAQQQQQQDDFIVSPFVVVIDTREQAPWSFKSIWSDSKDGGAWMLVKTEPKALASGDYSIAGLEVEVTVERKSKEDLYSSLGHGRRRFQAEFERMQAMRFAAVVVECSYSEIMHHPPRYSRMLPKAILRTIASWSIRYPRVHWFPMPGRAAAETMCYRLLEKFWQLKTSSEL